MRGAKLVVVLLLTAVLTGSAGASAAGRVALVVENFTHVPIGRLPTLEHDCHTCPATPGVPAMFRTGAFPSCDDARSTARNLSVISVPAAQGTALWNTRNLGFEPPQGDQSNSVAIDFAERQYTVTEGGNVRITVRLSGRPTSMTAVHFTVTPRGGATDADYKLLQTNVTFMPNKTEQIITFTALRDADVELNETITIGFGTPLPTGVVAGTPSSTTVRIIDDPMNSARDVLEALRARVTGGAVFFNGRPTIIYDEGGSPLRFESPQFGQTSAYLAFEAQPSVLILGVPTDGRGYPRFSLEPLVNVRLTTIPVKGVQSGAISNGTIQQPNPSYFLQSQKAAQVQLGTLANVNFGGFGTGDSRFHWALGPVYRTIFQSVTDEQRTVRIWNVDDDLYDAQVGGLRLALNERSMSGGGWMPTAYIDISAGKFQNFETATPNKKNEHAKMCFKTPRACLSNPPSEDHFTTKKEYRLYVEARVFIKSVYLGFDLNNGHGYDDLRFSAGVTVPLTTFFPGQD